MRNEEIVVRKHLAELPFFDPNKHIVRVWEIDGVPHIDYLTVFGAPTGSTHFSFQIEERHGRRIGFLDYIELQSELRGKSIEARFYQAIEEMARELSCHSVRQRPSGRTISGKSREQYLLERGYKNLPNSPDVEKVLA